MRLPSARIQNPTSREALRLKGRQLAQTLPTAPFFYILSWTVVLVGASGVVLLPVVCWVRGDMGGVLIFSIPAASALYELAKLALRRGVSLPAELFWSVLVGVPILSLLFFWISYEEPDVRSSPNDDTFV